MNLPPRSVLPFVAAFLFVAGAARAAERPNFVFILCDDLGYGDVSCLNPEGKIRTPNIDRVAREGMHQAPL